MNERKKLIDCFLNALARHILWIQKHPVEENSYICSTINDKEKNFEIRSYSDGSMSLDEKSYVIHKAYVNSVDECWILLNSYLASHGFEGLKDGDL